MPCGCVCIPWPILHILGESINRLLGERHGEVKISQSWLKKERKAHPVADTLDETIPF
jgi:hypothetical protein